MTEAKTKQNQAPHVYTALARILSALSVEKNGQLPANMGGKAYISAVDLSLEVKRQFVENHLILVPNEAVERHEIIQDGARKSVFIVIRGEYQVVSTEDSSTVTISGIGDGIAVGSAVAANIGSTNALKNALLRTFLVTEQSVEDEGKNGPKEAPEAVRRQQTEPEQPVEDVSKIRARIKEVAGDRDYMALGSEKFGKGWTSDGDKLRELLAMLEAGETV